MESQSQTQTQTQTQTQEEEEQQLQSTPVIVTTPVMDTAPVMDDDKKVQQSSVWWVNSENKQKPFFVISKNKHNHEYKTLTGFWLNQELNKSESRLSVRINFKDLNGKFQQGWVNVNKMTTVSEEDFDKSLGQSTKGFVHKVMDNFTRKIVGGSPPQQDNNRYNRQDNNSYHQQGNQSTYRGNGRGRGQNQDNQSTTYRGNNSRGGGRGRGSRGRGTYRPRHQENTQTQEQRAESPQPQENQPQE